MPPVEVPGSELRAARRAVARRYHPDRGGDVESYLRALSQLDTLARSAAVGATPVLRRGARGRLQSGRRRLSLLVRHARSRMPRGWPGAKRFAQL